MFSLERDLCLCTHRTSFSSHQQIENFPTFLLWTATKENITSDTWANSNRVLKCGQYQILCLEWSFVLHRLPGMLVLILQGEHMTRLLWYSESLYWSIPKVFCEISKAVSKEYFPLLLTLSFPFKSTWKIVPKFQVNSDFSIPIFFHKDKPMIMKPGTTVQTSALFRFKNCGPRSNSYFSANLKERICSISPFLPHFFNS